MFAGTGEVGPSLDVLDRFRSLVSSNWRHELTAIEVMIALYAGSIADGVEMLGRLVDTLSIAAELLALSYKPLAVDLALSVDLRSSDHDVRVRLGDSSINACARRGPSR
jgi:hypothetical protein